MITDPQLGIHSTRLKTFTRRDVATKVAARTSERISVADKWVDEVFVALREIMMSASPELRIEIRDFGIFEVKRTKSKPRARNPRTGETIFVPPHLKTHFKPSKLLKRFLQKPLEAAQFAPPFSPERPRNNGQEPEAAPESLTS